MSAWREATLADLCDSVDYGYTASASDDPDLPRFLRITDIVGDRLDWGGVPGCVIDERKKSRFAIRCGDIVVARTGATVGHAKLIRPGHPEAVFASYLVRFRPGADVNPAFLGAIVESQAYKDWVLANAGGAAQPNANAKTLGAFRLRVPDERTQGALGQIFSSFSDLIENNRRRIQVLEEMAKAIYREWFVRFRYPGHEADSLVESSLGPIPRGWRVSTCGDELAFHGGGTPSKKEPAYWDGGTIPWYTPSDLTKDHSRFAVDPNSCITADGLSNSSARMFPTGSVMMTSRATLGVLSIATTESCCNQGFIVVLPDKRWPSSFIYEWLDYHADELASLGTGATFKEITKGAFKVVPFVVPEGQVLEAFRERVEPLDGEILALERQVRVLVQIRDKLLPRLVTGRIDVSSLDLDAVVGASA